MHGEKYSYYTDEVSKGSYHRDHGIIGINTEAVGCESYHQGG